MEQTKRQLSVEETFQMAEIIEELNSPEEALPLYQDAVMREPSMATAHYAIGRIMAEQNRREAVEHLEYCMNLDSASVPYACRILFLFYMKNDNKVRANQTVERAIASMELLNQQHQETTTISSKDVLVPEQPSEAAIAALKEQLENHAAIERAHILRKKTTYTLDKKIYLVIVEFSINHTQQKQHILEKIASAAPNSDEYLLLELDELPHLRSNIKKHKLLPLYERKSVLKGEKAPVTV
ncbi:hypothetical protein ACFQZT_19165 [Paenibacillus sp. GCM10027628]|uniref:hypothetical protein n=1 Tax=Paenibacillus sp. GCM10027628 TaxID=3273413 RepID=UPI003630D3D1